MSRRDNSQSPSRRMGFLARILGGSPKPEESPAPPDNRPSSNPLIPPINRSSFGTRVRDAWPANSDSTSLNPSYQQPNHSTSASVDSVSVRSEQTTGTKRSAEPNSESQPSSNKRRKSVLLTTRGERISQLDTGPTRSTIATRRLLPNAMALQRPSRTTTNGINLALTREHINQRSNKRQYCPLREGPRHGPRAGPPPNRVAPAAPSNLVEQVFQRDQQSTLRPTDPILPQASSSRSSLEAGKHPKTQVQTIIEPPHGDLPTDDAKAIELIESMFPAVEPTPRVSPHIVVYSEPSIRLSELHPPVTQELFDENEKRISTWLAGRQERGPTFTTDETVGTEKPRDLWGIKKNQGIWKCTACYLDNPSERSTCLACSVERTSNLTSNMTSGAAVSGQITASGFTFTASLQSGSMVGTQTSSGAVTAASSGASSAGQITSSGFMFTAAPAANPFSAPSASQVTHSTPKVDHSFAIPAPIFGAPASTTTDGSKKASEEDSLAAKNPSDNQISFPPTSSGFSLSPVPTFQFGNGKREEAGSALGIDEATKGKDVLSPTLPAGFSSSPTPAFQFGNRKREDSSSMSLGSEAAGKTEDGSKDKAVPTNSFTFGASKANSTADNATRAFVFSAPAKSDWNSNTNRTTVPSFGVSTSQSSTDVTTSVADDAPIPEVKIEDAASKSTLFGAPVPGPTNGLIVDGGTKTNDSTTKLYEASNATATAPFGTQNFSFGAVGSQNTHSTNPFGSTKQNEDIAPSSTNSLGTSVFGTVNTSSSFDGQTFGHGGSAPAPSQGFGFGSQAATGAPASSSTTAFPTISAPPFGSSVAGSSESRPPTSFGAGFGAQANNGNSGSNNTLTNTGLGIGASGFGAPSAGFGSGFGTAPASNGTFGRTITSTSVGGFGASSATAPAFPLGLQPSTTSSAFPPVTSAFPPTQPSAFPTAFPNSQNNTSSFPQYGLQSFGGAQATSFAPSGSANPTSFGQTNVGFGSMNGNPTFGAGPAGQQQVFSMGRSSTPQPSIPGRRRVTAKRPVRR